MVQSEQTVSLWNILALFGPSAGHNYSLESHLLLSNSPKSTLQPEEEAIPLLGTVHSADLFHGLSGHHGGSEVQMISVLPLLQTRKPRLRKAKPPSQAL